MKKTSLLSAVLVLCAMTACMEERLEPSAALQNTVRFEAAGFETKTSLEGQLNVVWNKGDKISVYSGEGTLGSEFTTDILGNAARATFSGTANPVNGNYYAAYPSVAVQEWMTPVCPKMVVPSGQTAVKGSFANGLNLTVANTNETDMKLEFKNILSFLKFTVADSGVMSIEITSQEQGEKKTPLAGIVKVNSVNGTIDEIITPFNEVSLSGRKSNLEPGDYYVAILPNTYPEGLKFKFTNEKLQTAYASFQTSKTYESGHIYNLGTINGLTWVDATKATFEEIRGMAIEGTPVTIAESTLLEGHIVADKSQYNNAEDPRTSTTWSDSYGCIKTAYIQDLDGRYGIRIKFDTDNRAENSLKTGTRVILDLKDMVLEKFSNPTRYELHVPAPLKLAKLVEVAEKAPVKEKHINELTDDDVYTYVTLKDVEHPIRKGSLTPVHEGYSYIYSNRQIVSYPSLLRDINGDAIYMITNMQCKYRRNGEKLPYGKGSVSGIIVHEENPSFTYPADNSLGTYQIRHTRKEDIALSDDFDNSFSGLVTEYRFLKRKDNKKYYGWDKNPDFKELAAGEHVYPTYGNNGSIWQTSTCPIKGNNDYAALGPIIKNQTSKTGSGIILEDGTEWKKDPDKNGIISWGHGPAFTSGIWWNEEKNRGEAWMIEFSTKGITGALSMQLSVLNHCVSAPHYWIAEWSTTPDMESIDWLPIGDYYVPDMIQWKAPAYYRTGGFKQLNFKLPDEMKDLDVVYVRLRPIDKTCTDKNGEFGAGTLDQKNAWNAISYFAVRYNK